MSTPVCPAASPSETLWKLVLEGVLIAFLALTLNLAGNSRTRLWDRDEPRFVGAVREMRASGDLLRPTFNAEPRYHKPILIYWLMLASTALAGDNPFGARLVSALAGAATCVVVWVLGRRMFGRATGRLAALVLATAPVVFIESKLATTDAFLMLCLTACLAALWELNQRPSRVMVGVFWVGLALAMLTKGPVGLALIAVAGIVAWWWGAPTLCWKRLRWSWGLPIFAMIAAPWYLAIGIVTRGEFFRFAVGGQLAQRVASDVETHGGFPGYYLVLTLVLFYPWSALLPPGLVAAWRQRRTRPELAFLLGWIVGPWVVLELVRTKMIHYYLPSYPACCLLVAWLVGAVVASEVNLRRWTLGRLALGILTGLGIGMTVALLAGVMVLPVWTLKGPCLALAVLVAAGTLFALERFQAGATVRATTGLIATWAVVLLVVACWLAPAVEPYRLAPLVAHRLAAVAARTRTRPVLADFKPPSVVYEYGRPIPTVASPADVVAQIQRDGPLVTVLRPEEIKVLAADARLALETAEEVRGIDIEHGKNRTLHLVVIRPGSAGLASAVKPVVK